VLLAWLPEEERRALAEASAARFGDEAFDPESLREQLLRVKEEGWARSSGERSPGVAAIAAPVFDASGEVAGTVLVSAPAGRLLAKQRRKFAPLVREAASRASRDLGFEERGTA
ncbi:MAG: IclR family transcriptional regulator domain-containing protein, partial [Rubrobacteraceae bacterium]